MDTLDEKILTLRREGKSLRAIGRAVGMSHPAVIKRLRKYSDGNQWENKIQNKLPPNEAADQAERENQKSGYKQPNKPISRYLEALYDCNCHLGLD